jgi:membrane protease YdiL (CAAX protease family)
MLLIDTSVWIIVFRDRSGQVRQQLETLIANRQVLLTRFTQLELLQGSLNEQEWTLLSTYLETQDYVELTSQSWQAAARIYYDLRRQGLTVAIWWVGFGKPELSLAHPTRHQVLIGLLWGTIQQLVIIPIQLFQSSQASSTSSPSTNDPLAEGVISIGLVLLSVTYPVFVEEGVFRGFLLNSLRPFLPQWGSISINGILFAIWHLNSYKLPTTLIGGFLYTWLALGYGFWSAVIAHAWLNSSGVFLMLLGRWLGII